MSYSNVSAAFATRLNTLAGTYAIQSENNAFTPPANAPYLAESLSPTGVVPMAIASSGTESLEGFYQVLCYAPAGLNKGAAFAAANAVEALFTRGLRLSYGGTTATVLRTERSRGFRSGDRFVIPISVYFRALV